MTEPRLKIVICWISLSGYLAACWRALAKRQGVELRIVLFPTISTQLAPFAEGLIAGLPIEAIDERHASDAAHVASIVAAHRPDVVLIPGWAYRAFTGLPFDPRLAGVRFVMGMDTPWQGALRQRLARIKLARLVARLDRALVPGERAWQYARRLGFPESKIRRGMYGVDYGQFEPLHAARLARPGGWPRRFLFTGRYVDIKGVDVLLEAYAAYRRARTDPWPLTCCGSGPMAARIGGAEGVEDLGFVQPFDQPALWERCGAFVLSSRYDPWPLVIVEACAAGFPVLCTEACGSSVELVRSHYNGLPVATGDPTALAAGLMLLHDRHEQLPEMGLRGQQLAAAYSADAWAERIVQMCAELAGEKACAPV